MLNDRLQNTIDKLLERANESVIESKTKTPIQEKKSTLKGF